MKAIITSINFEHGLYSLPEDVASILECPSIKLTDAFSFLQKVLSLASKNDKKALLGDLVADNTVVSLLIKLNYEYLKCSSKYMYVCVFVYM